MLKVTDLVPGEEVEINYNCSFTKHPPFRFVRGSDGYDRIGFFVNSKGKEDVFSLYWVKRLPPESLPLESQIALKEKELADLKEKLQKEDWIEEGEILIGVRNKRHLKDNIVISNEANEITMFRAVDPFSLSELKSLFYKSLRRATPTEIASFEVFEQELKK